MKRILLGLVVAISIAAPVTAQGRNDVAREGLVGPVRVVRAESVDAIRGEGGYKPDGRPRSLGAVTYDDAGNYREREVMDDYGFPVGKETFEYIKQRLARAQLVDPKGALLEGREYAYGSSSEYQTVTIKDRSGDAYQEHYRRGVGDRIEAIRYVGAKEIGTTVFTYRSDPQKPDAITFFMPGGQPATASVGPCLGAHRLVYRYVDGRVSQRELFEEDGSLKRRSSFSYDSNGNVAEETRTDGPMASLFRYEYRYDDRGNWIRKEETILYDVGRKSEPSSPLLRITTRTIAYF